MTESAGCSPQPTADHPDSALREHPRGPPANSRNPPNLRLGRADHSRALKRSRCQVSQWQARVRERC